jgi:hypothetical protein
MDDRRSFDHNEQKYYIGMPTAESIKGADWTYSKVYTKSLTDGMMTAAEMQDALTRRGVIGADYEMRRQELEDILSQRILDLATAGSMEGKQQAAVDVAMAREELFRWNQRANGPMSNTCENIADDARLEYLSSRMIEDEEGKGLWETYEDFCDEKDQALTLACRFQVMVYLQGMQPDFLETTPEAVAMREIELELVELAKADSIMEVIDEEEGAVEAKEEKVEEKPKKKPGRPKKSTTKKKATKTKDKK